MLQNLKIEWMKIKNYRVFQVFSVLYLLGIIVIIYIFYRVYLEMIGSMQSSITGAPSEGSDLFRLFSENNIWRTVGFWTSFLLYFPGMIVITLFINEVNFKTHRQNIIDGWKRETFIKTKIGLIACMSLVITVMTFIAVLIMMQIVGTSFSIDGLYNLALVFVQSFIYLMFALLLATFFRRSGVAIIVFFIYGLLIEFLLFILLARFAGGAEYFLPLQVADSLITFPMMEKISKNAPALYVLVPAALAYGALYMYLTIRKYKYDDL